MKSPPRLRFDVRRSRLAAALIVASHAATALLVVTLPLPAGVGAAGATALGLACAWALRRAVGSGAPALLHIGADRRLVVTTRTGSTSAGEILADSFVGPRLTTIVWRPDGARRVRTLLVLADSLAPADFRRLRVLLRYSRAAGVGPPTSGTDAA